VPFLEQVELVGADFLGAELVGGAAEVAAEAEDVVEVGLQGAGAVVTQAEIVEEALP
jgi:hypothetical protein